MSLDETPHAGADLVCRQRSRTGAALLLDASGRAVESASVRAA